MITLKRLPDWRTRFETAVDDLRRKPFSWDGHDCGPGLVGRLVHAVTGVDVAARFAGRYHSQRGALRVMRSEGYDNLADLVASMLPEIHPSRASIGDVAAIKMPSAFGYALGVVNGERIFVLMPNGIGTVELLDAARAFKVG